MDLLVLLVFLTITTIIYFLRKEPTIVMINGIVLVYLGLIFFVQGLTCTASMFCSTNTTLIQPHADMGLLGFGILTFGSFINMIGAMQKRKKSETVGLQ